MYLKAEDLGDKKHTVTIYDIKRDRIGEDDKTIAFFREMKKGLVLNVTNGKTIRKIAGSEELSDWEGVKIVLYATEVDFKGERVPAIRVEAVKNGKVSMPKRKGGSN